MIWTREGPSYIATQDNVHKQRVRGNSAKFDLGKSSLIRLGSARDYAGCAILHFAVVLLIKLC